MKLLFLLFAPLALIAQEPAPTPATNPSTAVAAMGQNRGVIIIDAKQRGDDIVKALDYLKKDKPTYRIAAHTYSGQIISVITDIVAMPNGTLLLFKLSTPAGSKTQFVSVDDVLDLFYQ